MNITTVCSKTPFSKNLFYIETSPLICNANQKTGFYMIQILTEKNFSLVKHVIELI